MVPVLVSLVALILSGSALAEPNRLTLGAGAVVVRARPQDEELGLVALDGSTQTRGVGIARREPLPLSIVIELPAETTLERFVLPAFNDKGSAAGKHVRSLRIEASAQGPDQGFSELLTLVLARGEEGPQSFPVPRPVPARWLRVTALDRHTPAALDTEPHNFTELEGYGPQAEVVSASFDGVWRLRRLGLNDQPGTNLIALRQEGTEVSGCQRMGGREATIAGSIEQGLARLVSTDEQGNRVAFTAVLTQEGELSGVSFASVPRPFYAAADPEAELPACMPVGAFNPVEQALAQGGTAVLHGIHFDVDSAVLKPSAEAALRQILGALKGNDRRVDIEGHTDSDASDSHNQQLSERRAASVVAWLVAQGIEAGRLHAVGKGEASPMADNTTSSGRALNRRVEVRTR